MTPVNQEIVDPDTGDCMAACVASILDVPLGAVANFSLAPDGMFHPLFEQTMFAYGWKLEGNAIHDGVIPWEDGDINGHYLCSVPSKNFDCCNHSVIINREGVVVHDPSPSKGYQGENLFDIPRINSNRDRRYHYFHIFSKREDEMWADIQKCIDWHADKKERCRNAFNKSVTKCPDGE